MRETHVPRTALICLGLAAFLLLAASLLLRPFDVPVVTALADMLGYALVSPHGLSATLIAASPLAFCGVGAALCWRAGLFSLGFDGAYMMGALGAMLPGLAWPHLTAGAFLPLSAASAFLCAGAWSAPLGLVRARDGGNEVLFSLMMNFIAAFVVQALVAGPLRGDHDLPQTPALDRAQWLPQLPGLHAHAGIVVAGLAAVIATFVLRRTRPGLALLLTGLGAPAARYGGIRTARVWTGAALCGGGVAGLAGWCDVLGLQHRLIDGMGHGIGFQGVMLAVLCGLRPMLIVPVAIAYAALLSGAGALQRDHQIPAAIATILESLLVLALLVLPSLRRRGGRAMIAAIAFLAASLRLALPILVAALGECFAQNAGVLNLGLEGMMTLGALAGYITTAHTGSTLAGLAAALPTGLAGGTFLGWFMIRMRASQVVTGALFNTLATAAAAYAYRLDTPPGTTVATLALPKHTLFGLDGSALCLLALVPIASVVLARTRAGLALRATGEHPRAAASAGLNVASLRYTALALSCTGAALGGAYVTVCQIGLFRETVVSGQGFAALAMVIFGRWRPVSVALASLLFGALSALQFELQLRAASVPPQIFLCLPYLVAALAMSGVIGRARQPSALGIAWDPERRD